MSRNKQLAAALALAIAVGALLTAGIFAWPEDTGMAPDIADNPSVCTQEAKLCSDGSTVGRTGPNCEFAVCPSEDADSLVDELPTQFITTEEWPPEVAVSGGALACPESERRNIDGRLYCVSTTSEGAAGSVYTTYTYATAAQEPGRIATVGFTLRYVQCANYDEPDRSACETERRTFGLDTIVHRLVEQAEAAGSNPNQP